MSLTAYVADWILGLKAEDIPQPVKNKAIEHILDGYGVGLSGVAADGHEILRRHVATFQAAPQAQVFGMSFRAPAELAALLNGVAMHAMDFDDTQIPPTADIGEGSLTHPTTPALGAASAVAELTGASGEDMLVAFIAGVETQCRIANATRRRKGFHPTGIIGPFGALAAAGRLLDLNGEQMRYGFGIVAPLGGGFGPNNGTMTKWLHAGQAAQAGIFAAQLARQGFTAAPNMLEDPRGFSATAGEGHDPSRIEGKMGDPYFLVDPGIAIKSYPSGSLGHPGQEAVIQLIEENDIRPEDVEEATAGTNADMPFALRHPRPQTAVQARFSFPFNLAIALLRRRAGVSDFTDEVVQSPEVQEMLLRCHHIVDPEIDARRRHMETRIRITMKDGRVFETLADTATGHPTKSMTHEQLEAKFHDCAALAIDRSQAERAIEMIWNLESLGNVADLHKQLVGPTSV